MCDTPGRIVVEELKSIRMVRGVLVRVFCICVYFVSYRNCISIMSFIIFHIAQRGYT